MVTKNEKKNILTSVQYQKLIQEEVVKVISVLKNLAIGEEVKDLEIKNKRSPLRELFRTVNRHRKFLRDKKTTDLNKGLKELNEFKKKVERGEILEHAIINHMAEAMFVTDIYGNIIIINEIARETLGFRLNDNLIGKNFFRLIEWRDKKNQKINKEDFPLSEVVQDGKMVRVSFADGWSAVRQNGKSFPVRIYLSPIKIEEKVKAVIIVFHDATKERRIDEIKSDFISIASHQLRTPLAVATLHTEMLLAGHAGPLTNEQEGYIKEIHFYNKKMAELLNVFLSVSKIEMDTFTMEVDSFPIESILDDTIHELSLEINEKKIKILKIYRNFIPKIFADRGLLRVALQNVISNAIKYTPAGGRVTIETKKMDDYVLVKIKDTGMGIAEKDKSRVFMKLYRGKNAKKIDSNGTGLGLYITKSFIEKNHGEIWFDSQINVGTTFFILLPTKNPLKIKSVLKMKNPAN